MTGAARTLRRTAARVLLLGGAAVLSWSLIDVVRAETARRGHIRTLEHSLAAAVSAPHWPAAAPALGEPIGRLEIPRIGLAGTIVHGDSDAILKSAIGHLPDTPLPWSRGNTALAAHRDTLFRPLRHVRPDDAVRLETPRGTFDYRVVSTFVVDPEDVWVLAPSSIDMLTLITCYPFGYVGEAPRRFIVRAERIPAPAEAAGVSPALSG